MKIKHILSILLFVLLPIAGMATDEKDAEKLCDNYIFNDIYATYYNSPHNARIFNYVLGTKEKRGIYKNEIVKMCKEEGEPCDRSYYGGVQVFGEESPHLNILAFAIYLNNMEVFDTVVKENPNMRYLIDSAFYMKQIPLSNQEFMTPASILIENGMIGTLKDLTTKYKEVNLRKMSGRIHYNPRRPKPMDNLLRAKTAVEKWKNEGNEERLSCSKKVLEFVQNWYDEHNDKKTIEEATKYNVVLLDIAERNKIVDITPFEFTPSLDIFKIQKIEDNFAQNIDSKIDVIIEKIMRDFDLSAFGNQA